MELKKQKKIALEGLIVVSTLLFWAIETSRENKQSIFDKDMFSIFLISYLVFYLVVRFIVWAIMTLRKKEG